jgi:hypothetical protein
MIRYEIRILRGDNKPHVVSATMAGDFYALKRAQALAGEADGYEVWRGMRCIYRRPPPGASPMPVPSHPEPNRPRGVSTDGIPMPT